MANAAQGMYAPLPQSISDSDSEKEVHVDVRPKSNGINKKISNGYMIPSHMMEKKGKEGLSHMGIVRKCLFFVSILACFLTIGIFLFVLPCTHYCPKHISNWDNEREDFEYMGQINIVSSAFPNTNNLALLIRKSLIKNNNTMNGVMSIVGKNGAVAWLIPQVKEVVDLNCNLIDVNKDGILDCLLSGEMGLEAIDPVSGVIYYHVHATSKEIRSIFNIDMPVILPDLNRDGVNEMITVVDGKGAHNKIIIICGKTGAVLSKIVLKLCLDVRGVKFEGNNFILMCWNDTGREFYKIPIQEIENTFNNKSFDVNLLQIDYDLRKEYTLKNRKLTVNNTGTCPDCSTNITLYDDRDRTVWFLSLPNGYAMTPTSFSFQPTKANIASLKGHLNGYILKLWEYVEAKPRKNYFRRSLTVEPPRINIIRERVVLITFNETNVHVINASLTEITQLCVMTILEEQCQPKLENQEESLKIADLDQDGSQELISYSSNYVNVDGNWKLVSNMKVIRLEAELPKLYEVAK